MGLLIHLNRWLNIMIGKGDIRGCGILTICLVLMGVGCGKASCQGGTLLPNFWDFRLAVERESGCGMTVGVGISL
jgi:hypothetical protein